MSSAALFKPGIRRLPRSTPYRSQGPHRPSDSHRQIRNLWGCSSHQNNNNSLKLKHDLHRNHIRLILTDHHRFQKPQPQPQSRPQPQPQQYQYQSPPHAGTHIPRDQRTIYPDYHYRSWRSPGWAWGGVWNWRSFDYMRKPAEVQQQEHECRSTDKSRSQGRPNSKRERGYKARKSNHNGNDNEIWDWDSRPGPSWSSSRSHTHAHTPKDRTHWVKRELDADPYGALFGRRHEPFVLSLGGSKFENGLAALWRSIFGLGDASREEGKTGNGRGKERKSIKENGDKNKDMDMDGIEILVEGTTAETEIAEAERRDAERFEAERVARANGGIPRPEPETGSRTRPERGMLSFDPISGRMVPQPREPQKVEGVSESMDETHASAVHEPKVEQSDALPEKAETEMDDTSKPATEAPEQTDPTTSSTAKESEESPEPKPAPQSQPAKQPPVCGENVYEPPEIIPYTINNQAEAFEKHRPPKPPADYDEALSRSIDRVWQHEYNSVWPTPPKEEKESNSWMKEKKETESGLDRAGFLSRRDGETWKAEDEAKDLGSLRASDIRAAYEPRRQSIESEIEAAKPKDLSEPSVSKSNLGEIEDQSMPLKMEESKPIDLPEELPAAARISDEALTESALQQETPTIQPPIAETYRIFAYDPSSSEVSEAETTSSLESSSEHIHPTEVLTRLSHPAKFLPCLNQMQADGYEIVSGGGDILVFRRAKAESEVAALPGTGEMALPVNEGLKKLPGTEQARERPKKSRLRKVLGRMLVGGVATAGSCYAISVVHEYFTNGGEYGTMDSFTVFESERRHRD